MKLKPAQLNKAAQGDFLMGLPLPDDAEQVQDDSINPDN